MRVTPITSYKEALTLANDRVKELESEGKIAEVFNSTALNELYILIANKEGEEGKLKAIFPYR
jgi:hypothetical protein